jgi:hypothetical protein
MIASIQPACTRTATVTSCASPDPYRMALVAASLTAKATSSTTSLGMAPGTSAKPLRTVSMAIDFSPEAVIEAPCQVSVDV